MFSTAYFERVLSRIELMSKFTPKIINEYKEFREQFNVALKGNELIEKDKIPELKKKFYRMDLLILNNIKEKK